MSSELYVFNVFDAVSKNLLYSKYNFNFTLYSSSRNLSNTLTKTQIFKLFLTENGTTYDQPYSVLPGLEIFFTPITQDIVDYINSIGNIHTNYMSFTNPSTYVSFSTLVQNQFDLINYDDTKIRFIQDYTYTENNVGLKFTKYNFNFDSYSNDFNIWGSKLFIFTDFVVRCLKLSGAIPGTFGYGLPNQFVKYFIDIPDLSTYLITYSVTSNNLRTYKNPGNIDWNSYIQKNSDLNITDPVLAKKHYYMSGQFELRTFNFLVSLSQLSNADLVTNATASIYSTTGNGKLCSGFLYSNRDGRIYLVSCYHIIANATNINILRASLSLTSKISNVKSASTTAEFRVIGYDIMSDIIVGLFDPTLPYNSTFNIDLSMYQKVGLSSNYNLNNGDNVFYVGNIGSLGSNAVIEGSIMNANYYGVLDDSFMIGSPDSMLINVPSVAGTSGSPIWVGNAEGTDSNIICVGMINSKLSIENDTVSFSEGIQTKIMVNVINNIIGNWFYFNSNPTYSNDTLLISYLLKLSSGKAWLGTICSYYNSSFSTRKFPVLANLPYTGGIVIENFILGLNQVTKSFVTDVTKLGEFSTIKLDSPLLNTKIYKRFIESSKSPIVIKSFAYFNGLISEYNKFYVGRYGNQVSFGSFTYGFLPVINTFLTIEDANTYLFPYTGNYPKLEIEYYYYNGQTWVLDTETVGGTDASNFTKYTDPIGIKFYQNKFTLPYILYPYMKPYQSGILTDLGPSDSGGSTALFRDFIMTPDYNQYYNIGTGESTWGSGS